MPNYYHVDRSRSLSKGSKIELVKEFTNVDIWNIDGLYSKKDAIDRTLQLYDEGISSHGIQYLLSQGVTIFHPNTTVPQNIAPVEPMIEAIFELVRKSEYPDRPSRFKSMFAWCDLSQANDFREVSGGGNVFEIEANDAFIGDQNLLRLGGSVIGAYELAKQYWEGIQTNNAVLEAVLPLPKLVGNAI